MLSLINNRLLLKLKQSVSLKVPSRNIEPVCGPPRFPMTTRQKILIGGGTILLMMAIPIAGLLSVPTWSIKHKNLGKARKEPPADEPPAEEPPAEQPSPEKVSYKRTRKIQ